MVTASTDATTNLNNGQAFKVAYTQDTANTKNTAYGSLGDFPYMTSDNKPNSTDVSDLYMKVWQDSTCYTAIKNGWSVATGQSKSEIQAFATKMNAADGTDPWSDYRFAILNKIDLTAYKTLHEEKFKFTTSASTRAAGFYKDYWVGYCVRQDTFGGVCAEANVVTTWDDYNQFQAPAGITFNFGAVRVKKDSKLLKTDAHTTATSPVKLANQAAGIKGASAAATPTADLYPSDKFAADEELFSTSHYASVGDASIGVTSFTCDTNTCNNNAATPVAMKDGLKATKTDYAMPAQSGFQSIGAGASFDAGAMWTYLWGWVATTTTANQTDSNDLTFESGMKYSSWSITRDLFQAIGDSNCAANVGNCNTAITTAVTFPAIAAGDYKDLTVTRVAMAGSTTLVASAAAAIVAASLAF